MRRLLLLLALLAWASPASAQFNCVIYNGVTYCAGGIIASGTASFGWSSAAGGTVDVRLVRDGAGILAQRDGTNAQVFRVYNTFTSATNNERFSVDWQTQANVALVGTRTGSGGGNGRRLNLVAQTNGSNLFSTISLIYAIPHLRIGLFTESLAPASSATAGQWIQLGEGTSTATSGTVSRVAVVPTYNQTSGTAANTDLLVNRTETAVGSGAQRLIEAQIGNTTRYYLTAGGATGRGTQEGYTQAVAPTCTTNCGTSPSVAGSDTAGRVTMGATGSPASGWIVTFNGTWTAAPVCQVWSSKAGMVVGKIPIVVVTSTTTFTVTTNGTAPSTADTYDYRCTGIQ